MGPYIYSADQTTPAVVHGYQVAPLTGNLAEISGSPFNPGVSVCCQALAISGNPVQAISGPAATIFPSTASTFTATAGTVSATQIFSIVNIGNQVLALNSISIAGTNASSFSQTNTCLATLAPNTNCSVSITFNPASAGTFTASLQVADNAPGSPQTLSLNGTGTAPVPAVTFSPTAPAFPTTTQGTSSAPQTLTLINSGSGPLHVSTVSLTGPNPSDFSFTNNCTAPVAPASNWTIAIVFSPIAPGQRTATLLVSDDAQGSPQTVSLSATANPAFAVAAVAGSSTTASVTAGQTAQYQMQLTPGPGYSGTVSLACSGAPLGATCHVPASVSLANGAATPFTVTVNTSGPALLPPSLPVHLTPISQVPLLPLLALALLLLISQIAFRAFETAASRNRFAASGVLAAALLWALFSVAACGGGSAAVAPPPVITPSGTSTITIALAATSSSGQPLQLQPIQLTLTVQ
jgi:trimeric autotransporter adhesin